ncbi:hypothetical protein VPH35_040322 [Triticum aestivum]
MHPALSLPLHACTSIISLSISLRKKCTHTHWLCPSLSTGYYKTRTGSSQDILCQSRVSRALSPPSQQHKGSSSIAAPLLSPLCVRHQIFLTFFFLSLPHPISSPTSASTAF